MGPSCHPPPPTRPRRLRHSRVGTKQAARTPSDSPVQLHHRVPAPPSPAAAAPFPRSRVCRVKAAMDGMPRARVLAPSLPSSAYKSHPRHRRGTPPPHRPSPSSLACSSAHIRCRRRHSRASSSSPNLPAQATIRLSSSSVGLTRIHRTRCITSRRRSVPWRCWRAAGKCLSCENKWDRMDWIGQNRKEKRP